MRAHIRLGRVAGVPIGLHLSVLLAFALIAEMLATTVLPATAGHPDATVSWAVAVVVAVAFFAALLAHELAHAVVARHYGVGVKQITLWALGGVAELEGEAPTPRADLAIAVVGPLASLVVGAVSLAAAYAADALGAAAVLVAGLVWMAGINVLLAVFNLLPGAPLDGGRVLRAALWLRTGDRDRAAATATRAGRGLGVALIALGVAEALLTSQVVGGLWLVLVGWFLVAAATVERQALERHRLLAGVRVADVMSRDLPTLPAGLPVAAALDLAATARAEEYLVTDLAGEVVGTVTVAALLRAGDGRWRTVGDLDRDAADLPSAAPEEDLAAVVDRTGGGRLVVVRADGDVVGVLTPDDVRWSVRRARLQHVGRA